MKYDALIESYRSVLYRLTDAEAQVVVEEIDRLRDLQREEAEKRAA